ncbi:MAG: histidine phosphatase family protein [Bacillota bacterium]
MRIYLTRHGQTVMNTQHIMQGWKDSPLTEKGIFNAKALARHLRNVKFHEVYSSTSGRALHTAELISGFDRGGIRAVDELKEIFLGEWEGRAWEEVEKEYPEEYRHFWKSPHLYKRNDAESFYDVQKRAIKLIKGLIRQNSCTDNNLLLVSHTVTVKTIMAYFEEREFERLWEPPYIHDTSLSVIEIDSRGHEILLHGDISHLEAENNELKIK